MAYPPLQSGGGGPCAAWWRGHPSNHDSPLPRPVSGLAFVSIGKRGALSVPLYFFLRRVRALRYGSGRSSLAKPNRWLCVRYADRFSPPPVLSPRMGGPGSSRRSRLASKEVSAGAVGPYRPDLHRGPDLWWVGSHQATLPLRDRPGHRHPPRHPGPVPGSRKGDGGIMREAARCGIRCGEEKYVSVGNQGVGGKGRRELSTIGGPLSCVFQALARGQARSQMQENAFSPARGEIGRAPSAAFAKRQRLWFAAMAVAGVISPLAGEKAISMAWSSGAKAKRQKLQERGLPAPRAACAIQTWIPGSRYALLRLP
jgi:hypothetical protein